MDRLDDIEAFLAAQFFDGAFTYIGVHHLGGNQFAIRPFKRSALISRHGTRIYAGDCAGSFHAYRANRITQQRYNGLSDGR